jgi:hypothetical protein
MESFRDLVTAHEQPLVEDVFADALLAQHVAIPPSIRSSFQYRLCVDPTHVGLGHDAFGDADAVLVESDNYAAASAVEFKRVKITEHSFATGQVNKLKDLEKACSQANKLHEAGFAHAWLTVIIVADTRSLTGGSSYGLIPATLRDDVIAAIPTGRLHPSVGLTVCEIVQVSDEPANFRGMSGGNLIRTSQVQAQPRLLTEGITRLFRPLAS